MSYKLKIVNPESVLKALTDLHCGKTRFAQVDSCDFAIASFEIKPPDGYEPPKNFPSCCEYHQHVLETTQAWFDKFPACCGNHKKLLTATWFKKSEYEKVASKVVDQLSYTEHIILSKFDNEDWYEDITDYIEYNYSSFGQLPDGYGPAPGLKDYLGNLEHYLKSSNDPNLTNSPEKTNRLLEFVTNYYKPAGKCKVDLNMLDTLYKNWLKIFPFNITYFTQLKTFFQRQFPILTGTPTKNRYTGHFKIKIKTQSELIAWLSNTTKVLLQNVNSAELVKNNLIPDSQKMAVELINESHRIKQDTLLTTFTKGEIEYVNVLREWINNEKKYFKELTNFLKTQSGYTPKIQYPPVDENVFEDFVCDLLNAMYPQSHYERFGKRGNVQKGIDLLSIPRKEAVQCKKKELSRKTSDIKRELRNDFESDLRSAMNLDIEITLMIFASTFEDNAALSEHLQKLKRKHCAKFDVMYMGWNSLSSHLHGFPYLIKKYYGK